MKIRDAILAADRARHNEISAADKLRWLSELDGRIVRELFHTHEHWEPDFRGYDETTDVDSTVLLVGPPYEELYLRYLVMQIDLAHGELERYNNGAMLFGALYRQYAQWFHRVYPPKGVGALAF